MGKIGPKFSHFLTVMAEGVVPPPPLTVSLTVKIQFFFTTSLSLNEECPNLSLKKNPDIEKHWYILFNQMSRTGIQNKLVKLLLAQNAKCIERWGQTLA